VSLAILNARIVTLCDATDTPRPAPHTGPQLADLAIRPRASILIEGDRIARIVEGDDGAELLRRLRLQQTIDARGRVLLPGFTDCHTHACFAGNRLDEWDLKRRGTPYLDILKAGGGIMSTVRAVRQASQEELTESLLARLHLMLAQGSTTIEVKSGYGLTPAHELKMLRAIRAAAARFSGTLIPTALLGHALDPASVASPFPQTPDGYVDWIIAEALPAITAEIPGIAVDAFCESGAWSLDQCTRLFAAAIKAGHPIRVHADQFNTLGMTEQAVRMGATSVDHLEASTPAQLAALASSADTFGVILPICGLHVDDRYAPARAFIDSAPTSKLALATNFNPGSAPCGSMPMAIALAVRKCGLSPAEAIAAATVNPACLLGLQDRGAIAPGLRADLVLLRHTDERSLAYEFGHTQIDTVICAGRVIP
jgi:imidazolonepropionase